MPLHGMRCCYLLLQWCVLLSSSTVLSFWLDDRDRVPVPVFKLAKLLDELVEPVVAGQQACFSGPSCDRFLMHVVESLHVVWVLGRASWAVVGCGGVVKLIGTSPSAALNVPLPLPWLFRSGKVWSSSVEVTGSSCPGAGWNFIISFTL